MNITDFSLNSNFRSINIVGQYEMTVHIPARKWTAPISTLFTNSSDIQKGKYMSTIKILNTGPGPSTRYIWSNEYSTWNEMYSGSRDAATARTYVKVSDGKITATTYGGAIGNGTYDGPAWDIKIKVTLYDSPLF